MKVSILINADQEKHVADRAIEVLERHSIPYELNQHSAHLNLKELKQHVTYSDANLFICVSGGSAALAGIVSGLTQKPVIGVPVSDKVGGLDSILSTVQTPVGAPVATVGLDNGKNAAYLALRILNVEHAPVDSNSELSSSASSSPAFVPDFMQSATPSIGGFFDTPVESSTEEPEKKVTRKRATGDWSI